METTGSSELEGAEAEEMPSDKVADLVEYIEVTCSEEDAGRVIGRKGRTIKAIRTLARALGQRVGTAVEVEVVG